MTPSDDIEALYRRYGPMVYRRCLRLLRQPALAQDALHDVFVRALKTPAARSARQPAAYLHLLATHVSLNRIRADKLRATNHEDTLLYDLAHRDDLEARTSAHRLLTRLFASELPSTRTLAVLHLVDRMTLEDVAEEVGLSVSGVRLRLRKLKQKLEELEGAR